jgi:uncharacterized protein (DUF58 family)
LLEAQEVLVWPRMGKLDQTRFRRFLIGALPLPDRYRGRPRPQPQAQTEFFGLRHYRPGDSPRSIHWRSSARRRELLVRECEEPAGEDLILVVDPSLEGQSPDAFEEAVSLAATICRVWCRRAGNRLALVIAGAGPIVLDGPTGPAHERRMLDRLAVLEPGAASTAQPLARTLLAAHLPHAPVVLIAAAAGATAGIVQRALRRSVLSLNSDRACALGFYQKPADHLPAGDPEPSGSG